MVREAGAHEGRPDTKKFPHLMFHLKLFETCIYLFKKRRQNTMLFNSCSYNHLNSFAPKYDLGADAGMGGMEN